MPALPSTVTAAVRRGVVESQAVRVMVRSGMVGLVPPWTALALVDKVRKFGMAGGLPGMAALQHGDGIALIDERGPVTFAELDRRSNALANAWRAQGLGADSGVGILCRNHRGILDALFAAAKIGATTLMLNTDFAAPQLLDVCNREGVGVLVCDEEFLPLTTGWDDPSRSVQLAWTDDPDQVDASTPQRIDAATPQRIDALIAAGDTAEPPAPASKQRLVMLTSGTTGTPKGAPRHLGWSVAIPAAVLSKIPYRAEQRLYVAAPLFHAWGLLNATTGLGLGSTIVMARKFDADGVLASLAEHRCTALVVVPVMLSRLLTADPRPRSGRDLSALQLVACAGAQLPGELATRALDAFGDVYNVYGSTEVAYAAIAVPADLRAAPGCVGRPPLGSVMRILDDQGEPVAPGVTGRIFVGSVSRFSGYTGGGTKEEIDGLLSSGDVGHLDSAGRLFVDGRDDEMIVSGGENVFPREVEELLARHDTVDDVAVIGVGDVEFGHRLRAFVVGRDVDPEALKGYVRDNLARYKTPRDVVVVDELPRNPSGKVLKRELAEREIAGP